MQTDPSLNDASNGNVHFVLWLVLEQASSNTCEIFKLKSNTKIQKHQKEKTYTKPNRFGTPNSKSVEVTAAAAAAAAASVAAASNTLVDCFCILVMAQKEYPTRMRIESD